MVWCAHHNLIQVVNYRPITKQVMKGQKVPYKIITLFISSRTDAKGPNNNTTFLKLSSGQTRLAEWGLGGQRG